MPSQVRAATKGVFASRSSGVRLAKYSPVRYIGTEISQRPCKIHVQKWPSCPPRPVLKFRCKGTKIRVWPAHGAKQTACNGQSRPLSESTSEDISRSPSSFTYLTLDLISIRSQKKPRCYMFERRVDSLRSGLYGFEGQSVDQNEERLLTKVVCLFVPQKLESPILIIGSFRTWRRTLALVLEEVIRGSVEASTNHEVALHLSVVWIPGQGNMSRLLTETKYCKMKPSLRPETLISVGPERSPHSD
jgi:hypothetical protein